MHIQVRVGGGSVRLFGQYTIRTVDPTQPFSVDRLDLQISSVKINGKHTTGNVRVIPKDGGRQYKMYFELERV